MKNTYLSLMLLLLFSCEQRILSPRLKYTAIFIDETTGLPIEDVSVELFAIAKGLFTATTRVDLPSTISNKNGKAVIRFQPVRNVNHYGIILYSKNYNIVVSKSFKAEDIRFSLTQNYKLIPKAKLKLNYKNVKPFDEKDYMWAFFDNLKDIGFIYPKNTTGKNIDGTETFEVNGNKLIEFDIRVTKNGKLVRYKESTFIKPFVLNEYTINY